MLDIQKEWIPVVLAIVGPTLVGIGWWFKARRMDRLARELERKNDKLRDLEKIERLQATIFEMQQNRIADEANKRREADVSVKLMSEMTVLLKQAIAATRELETKDKKDEPPHTFVARGGHRN